MAQIAGRHGERLARAAELLTTRGRKEQGRFLFEGPTLLEEALRSGVRIDEIFATQGVIVNNPLVRQLDASGVPVYVIDERALHRISDVETPSGLVAAAPAGYATPAEILACPLSLVLADLNDPGNSGTLLRSAEAFGAGGVICGPQGVDPYHPKVVRGSMGAVFRLQLAVAGPGEVAAAAGATAIYGLDGEGEDLHAVAFSLPAALVVGHERRGLGAWGAICSRKIAIPMPGRAESLNAAVAGSIALYEASKGSKMA
jgi:TrmH family RNA methyltransferase